MSGRALRIRVAPWPDGEAEIRRVRGAVFTGEQGIDATVDFDGSDAACLHVLAVAGDGSAVGTGRVTADGHIGRMAVLEGWRGAGVGGRLLGALVDEARSSGLRAVRLNAQVQAIAFYERHGFTVAGEPFEDAGLPHVPMERTLREG